MKVLKAILFVTMLAGALSLGACAHKSDTMSSSTTASSTRGYSK